MPSMNHVHTYVRFTKDVFRCSDKHCYHTANKTILVGKASICNECGEEFVLSRQDLRRARPRCLKCSKTKKALIQQSAAGLIDNLFKSGKNEKEEDGTRP